MPTENERKYVLTDCEDAIAKICDEKIKIDQGYLPLIKGSLRIRKSIGKKENYNLTFKLNNEIRIIEVETKLDKRDFDDIWVYCLNKLSKVRYKVKDWEIDFFKDHNNQTYFSMAEIEMEEGKKEPEFLPSFIKKNLIHTVAEKDGRFSSKLLSEVRYAVDILNNLNKN